MDPGSGYKSGSSLKCKGLYFRPIHTFYKPMGDRFILHTYPTVGVDVLLEGYDI